MSTQSKTFLKFIGSIILITLILDVMLRNVLLSSGVAFLISVTFFYSPEKIIAKREKEEAKNKEVSSKTINSNKKKKKNTKK